MGIIDFFQTLSSNIWLYGGTFILVLSILVFVHEWGHYIVARMCGVKVEVFSIGFGKELFGVDDKHGTRWKFSLIPLGGYVKMYGDTDPASAGHEKPKKLTKKMREQAFFAKPVWKRAAVVFAGPAINYIFAIILLAGLYTFHGQPVTPPQAAAVIGGSAAERAGFQPHDEVISIDGKSIDSFEDIRREMMIALDQEKHFVVRRGDEQIDIYASPDRVTEKDRFGFQHSRGLLGLISPKHAVALENITKIDGDAFSKLEEDASAEDRAKRVEEIRQALQSRLGSQLRLEIDRGEKVDVLYVAPLRELNEPLVAGYVEGTPKILVLSIDDNEVFLKQGPIKAIGNAINESYVITRGTFEALSQMVMGTRSAKELGGIIRIGALAGDMAQQGLIALILFTALLSINLGLINLFPIPLLDGGHLMFYAFEAILGKPIPERFQEYAFRAGFAFLIGVMAFANINDILQLIL